MNSQNAKRARGPEETIFVDMNGEEDDPFGFSQAMRESKYLKVKREDCTDVSDLGPDLPNGDINWDCSCMGSQPFGPCGKSFLCFLWTQINNYQYVTTGRKLETERTTEGL